jgi:hypothetical protein
MWSILIVTLPTRPSAVRLRIWRALKVLGCAALRDGAYLLPLDHTPALEAIATEVREHGGTGSVLTLSPKDQAQRLEILAQFDRTEAYTAWHESLRSALAELSSLPETEARRRVRGVADALLALQRIDYYPGPAAAQAHKDLVVLRRELDKRFSKSEPQAAAGDIPRLDARKFQGKRWATRARPWVDRLACAWLIARFIDKEARFVWLADPVKSLNKVPRNVLGFDYDGARFTHVTSEGREHVSFEVLMISFGLHHDTRLKDMALAVHYLDAGGIPVAQAAGLEAVLGGLRAVHADDDALLAAASAVFDALYANPANAGTTRD